MENVWNLPKGSQPVTTLVCLTASNMWRSLPTIALYATCFPLLVYWVLNTSLFYLCILMCMGNVSLLQVQLEFKAHGVAIIQYWEKSIESLGEMVCLAAQPFYKFDGFLLRTSGIHSKATTTTTTTPPFFFFFNIATWISVSLVMVGPAFGLF